MILLHKVVEILELADGDRGAVLGLVALDGRCIGRTPSMVSFSATPWRRMAFWSKRSAASSSRCSVSRQSRG